MLTIWYQSRTILDFPHHRFHTRFKDRQCAAAMDSLDPEARLIYDLLKEGLTADQEKRAREQQDSTVIAVRKMFDENTARMDAIVAKIDGVRDEFSTELAQIRLDLDKGGRGDHDTGATGSVKGHGFYKPPPLRGSALRMSSAYHPETDGQTERVNQQVECFSRCFISAHPTKWSKWLSSCEFWYNTNWHSSLNKTPFEVLYGQHPTYFGLSANSAVARVDVQQWLDQRKVILASVRQHLLRASQRMKLQADKKCTERSFQVGDMVFLKLQPYVQTSVVHRSNHKLDTSYFPCLPIEAMLISKASGTICLAY